MRDYAKVSPRFWLGETGRELRKAGAEAQVVAFYLMTSPHANMLGLYYLPVLYLAHETGLGLEGASKGLQRGLKGLLKLVFVAMTMMQRWSGSMKWQLGRLGKR